MPILLQNYVINDTHYRMNLNCKFITLGRWNCVVVFVCVCVIFFFFFFFFSLDEAGWCGYWVFLAERFRQDNNVTWVAVPFM